MDILYSIILQFWTKSLFHHNGTTTNCRLKLLVWRSNSFLQTVTIKSRDNGKGLDQRSGTFPLRVIHLCGVSAGSAVLLRFSRQLVGSCTINDLFRWSKGKGKVYPRIGHKFPQSWGRGIALLCLNLGARYVWMVKAIPRPHFTLQETRYPLYRGPSGSQGRKARLRKI
jgi:hypothetical protein